MLQFVGWHIRDIAIHCHYQFYGLLKLRHFVPDNLVNTSPDPVTPNCGLVYLATNHDRRPSALNPFTIKHIKTEHARPGWPPMPIDASYATVPMKPIYFC